jgi:hypothetical protein
MKYDRFKMEENIMQAWGITDEINLVYETLMEKDMTKDEIANALLGIVTMGNIKMQRVFEEFEKSVKVTEPEQIEFDLDPDLARVKLHGDTKKLCLMSDSDGVQFAVGSDYYDTERGIERFFWIDTEEETVTVSLTDDQFRQLAQVVAEVCS